MRRGNAEAWRYISSDTSASVVAPSLLHVLSFWPCGELVHWQQPALCLPSYAFYCVAQGKVALLCISALQVCCWCFPCSCPAWFLGSWQIQTTLYVTTLCAQHTSFRKSSKRPSFLYFIRGAWGHLQISARAVYGMHKALSLAFMLTHP